MFFLVRVAFWLTVVLVLLPSGSGEKSGAQANIGATDALIAASAAVSDMSNLCDRQPKACEVGAQAAVVLGQRAQAGAKMVYDLFSEHSIRGDAGSVTNGTERKWPVSQNTLTTADLEPAWQGPAVQAETLPMPRRDPRRKA
ncbi:MAG: DUF5330 domain-containing protein [Xanthobacteraceae bacterium]|nr:DUF5330 domain-containing protein [Xanthobacteraceae bacterium]